MNANYYDARTQEERERDDELLRQASTTTSTTDSQNLDDVRELVGMNDEIDKKELFHIMTNMAGVTLDNAHVNDYFGLFEGYSTVARALMVRPEVWMIMSSSVTGLNEGHEYSTPILKGYVQKDRKWRHIGNVFVEKNG